jgi:para-aminobenzoate synthetase component I
MPPTRPIVEPLPASLDPALAFQALHSQRLPHLLFLDSAKRDDPRGRYSYLMAQPCELLCNPAGDAFYAVQAALAKYRAETLPGLPPFQGGAAGLFAYDLAGTLENLPKLTPGPFPVHSLTVGVYPWVIAWDHMQNECWLIAHPHVAAVDIPRIKLQLQNPANSASDAWPRSLAPVGWRHPVRDGVTSNFNRAGFIDIVRRGVEYIHAGDCFQVNLAQTLYHPAQCDAFTLYLRLRNCNPAPFAAYMDTGSAKILSASPERFLQVQGHQVQTRPIKGTRPRGKTPAEEVERIRELQSSPKDRAENVMIVDLLRNDIGKSCEFGSVIVPKVCEIETFATVHHMVSEVTGTLKPGVGAIDLLRGAFPGGSVTGAPKVRAMEIISELEATPRGAYCGSLGFIGFDGTMDTNILIRTITVTPNGWSFPVGGGIVADSIPEMEYEETLHKAEGLIRAMAPG